MRLRNILFGTVMAAALLGGGSVQAADLVDLPPGPGREAAFYTCSACHSFALVTQQRQTRQGWEELIDWMIAEQGMHPPDPETRALIVGYLSENFGAAVEAEPSRPAVSLNRPLEAEDLPAEPGRDETFYTCAACHSFNLVAQQGLTRRDWDELIDWMVEEQGMDEPDAETRQLILDYLARWFGPERRFLTTAGLR